MDTKPIRPLGRRGIALPVALVALVGVSLMVTTALLTSSTEYAISAAHTAGTQSLYAAESGLQEFVRQNAMAPAAIPVGAPQTLVLPPNGDIVQVSASLLGVSGPDRTYALTVQPVTGNGRARGRAVVAMIRQHQPPPTPLEANITSAVTLGGDLHVNGNAFTVSGYDACRDAGHTRSDAQAVRASSSSGITTNNARHMDNFVGVDGEGDDAKGWGAIDRSELSRAELARDVLGGSTVQALAASVPNHKRWGPRFDRPAWNGYLHPDTLIAVVDGNGGMVSVQGGEGLLLVINGGVEMRGNSTFKGVIIAEGNFDLRGTPTVEGALISLAMDGQNEIHLDDSAIGAGHVTVKYNKCLVESALAGWGQVAGQQPPQIVGQTFAWHEVVR